MPEIVAEYRFPHPRIRQSVAWLLALGLMAAALAILIQLLLIPFAGPLLCVSALLTAVLAIPLLLQTALHPEISIASDGLILHPMLWPPQFVAWTALTQIVAHPLVYNDPAMGRVLYGRHYHPREGAVVVLNPAANVWPVYRLVGQLAGAGNVPAFAISSTTHTGYESLIGLLREHLATTSQADES
jgi:hypothetical protein